MPSLHTGAVMIDDEEGMRNVLEAVAADIAGGFEGVFSSGEFRRELHGSDLDENEVFATAKELVAVPWVYRCRHIGDFLGVPPTFIEIELRGATFVRVVSPDPKEWDYFRYIDYVGALHQLGVTTTSRPALTVDEFENWAENNQDVARGVGRSAGQGATES